MYCEAGVDVGKSSACLRVQEGPPTVARVNGCISLNATAYDCSSLALNLTSYTAYNSCTQSTPAI